MMALETILVVAAFWVGGIPFGAIFARAKGVDILKAGSGNIGATNVQRVLGLGPGVAVMILDIAKGLAPTLMAHALFQDSRHSLELGLAGGVAAMLGHCYSPFLKLHGGKGISTAFGAIAGTAPFVALCGVGVFVAVIAATRYVSLGSIVGASSVVAFGAIFGNSPSLIVAYACLATFIIVRHRANIRRLCEGTERKFSFKRSAALPETRNSTEEAASAGNS